MRKSYSDIALLNIAAFAAGSIIIVMTFWNLISLNRNSDYSEWINHTYEVIAANNQVLTELLSAETNVRGYAASNDPSFLKSYYEARNNLSTAFKQLDALTHDALQSQRLDTMKALSNQRLERMEEVIQVRTNAATDKLRDAVQEANKLTKEFALVSARFDVESNRVMNERKARLNHVHDISIILLLAGSLISILILFIAFIDLRRQILQRIKTERDLYISREWFSKTLASLGDGVIATNPDGVITFLNQTAEDLTGWNKTDALGKSLDFVFEIVNEFSGEPVVNPIKRALQQRQPVMLANHTLLIRKDRTKKYIDDSAAPIFNDNNELVGAVLIFRDISDQVSARKKLIESEDRLRKIVENAGAIISIRDVEGRYTMVNPAFEKLVGMKATEVLGKTSAAVIEPEEHEAIYKNLQKALTSEEAIITEEPATTRDGVLHHFISVRFRLQDADGNVTGVCTISTDITAHKKLMQEKHDLYLLEKIRESQFHYKELADSISEMFFSMDESGKIIFWNTTCEITTGKGHREVLHKSLDHAFSGAEHVILTENLNKALHEKKKQTFSLDLYTRNTLKTYRATIYPASHGISVIMTDITFEKEAEEETLQLVENLQQKNKDLKQFAYIVSHNLRAPIAKIQGLTDLFQTSDTENELNQKIMFSITDELKNLDIVVNDLSDIISIRDIEGKQREKISLHDELKQVLMVLSNQVTASGAVITENFTGEPEVRSIKSYIHSILLNLISNALKYRDMNRPLRIGICSKSQDQFVCISVHDNGLGINLEKHNTKLFTLYKRFHNHVEGRGIGLYLVKTQIESLGGKVEVSSRENEGSVFKIFIPKN